MNNVDDHKTHIYRNRGGRPERFGCKNECREFDGNEG